MPSLRKVVEEVEYNTLPSPTTRGFSSAAARANKKLTIASDGGVASGKNAPNTSRRNGESDREVEAGAGNEKQIMKTNENDGSKKEVIEIQSDGEDVTLSDLAKIKQNGSPSKIVCLNMK